MTTARSSLFDPPEAATSGEAVCGHGFPRSHGPAKDVVYARMVNPRLTCPCPRCARLSRPMIGGSDRSGGTRLAARSARSHRIRPARPDSGRNAEQTQDPQESAQIRGSGCDKEHPAPGRRQLTQRTRSAGADGRHTEPPPACRSDRTRRAPTKRTQKPQKSWRIKLPYDRRTQAGNAVVRSWGGGLPQVVSRPAARASAARTAPWRTVASRPA